MPIKAFRPSNVPDFYLENIPNPESVMNMIPFFYSGNVPAIGANSSAIVNIPTFADSDFLCISLQSDNGSTPNIIIRDSSTNWPLMASRIPVSTIFGVASLPYFLSIPWFLIAKTSIENTVSNGAAASIAFTLTYSGLRIFRR